MVYCQKCGKKNEDDAEFCSKCGASLIGKTKEFDKEWDKRCDEDCHGGGRGWPFFWGVVIILVGLWVVFEFVLKHVEGLPSWVYNFPFWGVFALLVGILIIMWGLRVVSRH